MTTKRKIPTHGMRIQPRDLDILASAGRFRFLTSEHVHRLHFAGRSLRAVQHRLIRLYQHGFLLRCHLPLRIGATHQERTGPVYGLSAAGAEELAEAGLTKPPFGLPWKGLGSTQLLHHLTAVDVFVALAVALATRTDAALVVETELVFRQRLEAARQRDVHAPRAVVPDGAVTLIRDGQPATVYLEVVRAEVRGGSREFCDRLRRYAELQHRGVLTDLYGHARVRAVLWLASSPRRAETLRKAAEQMPHGRQLFWFGSYAEPVGRVSVRSLNPETILDARFTTVDGGAVSFFS